MAYSVIEANKHHGFYIEDEHGRTVCDFYFMTRDPHPNASLPYKSHPNAKQNAARICAALNVT